MTMRQIMKRAAVFGVGAIVTVGCDQPTPVAPAEPAASGEALIHRGADKKLNPKLCALSRHDFTLKSTNDYFPLGVGSRWLLRGKEDGVPVELRITVLEETEVVGGVRTRVIEERHIENGELAEVSRNFFAATKEGTACYLGEEVDIYEDGEIVSHEGAWRADAPGNRPGIFIPADPRVGMKYDMEGAPGVAEDEGEIVAKGKRERVPAGTFTKTIRIRELNRLDGGVDFKVFARGVGIIVDGPLSLVKYRIVNGDDRDSDDEDG
jgi:hypothetical protein